MGDWLDNAGPQKPKRPSKGSNDGTLDIQSAVDFLEGSDERVFALSKDLAAFSLRAKALLDGGLTREAIVVLLQDALPKSHGRPVPAFTIIGVLEAAGALADKYLKPEALAAIRAGKR